MNHTATPAGNSEIQKGKQKYLRYHLRNAFLDGLWLIQRKAMAEPSAPVPGPDSPGGQSEGNLDARESNSFIAWALPINAQAIKARLPIRSAPCSRGSRIASSDDHTI